MSNIQNKTVVAASASKTVVTLYFDDGTDMKLAPNEQFTLDVMEKVTPALARNEKILLNMQSRRLNIYTEMEKKTNGLVKFFRVAKKALLGIDAPTEQQIISMALPMEDYNMSSNDDTIVAVIQKDQSNVQYSESAPSPEAHVAPARTETQAVSASSLAETSVGIAANDAPQQARTAANLEPDTSVAHEPPQQVPTSKVIVGAEALRNQIKHFSEQENPVGFNAFMERIAKVVDQRRHTVSELLTFLDKGDLPIADDGCIVAYKRLRSHDAEYMVDSHSGKVKQKVGSRVFMKPEMVDPDRRNECSNGLHIGRRDYMGSFSGDTIIICKVAPEDVIAVPSDYSGSKMRCAGYNIVYRLNDAAMAAVIRGEKMTGDNETAIMLTKILRGDHTSVIETTEITQTYGGGLIITPVGKQASVERFIPLSEETMDQIAEPVKPTHALEQVTSMEAVINPELNSPKAIKERAKAAPKKPAEVVKAEATGDARKVKKAKRKAAEKAPEPVAEVRAVNDDMTEHQKLAQARWAAVQAGSLSKVKLAQECKTSTRSLDRWAEKFNF